MPTVDIIYSPNYNYYAPRFIPHPFLPDKAGQIFNNLVDKAERIILYMPLEMTTDDQLLKVHSSSYLANLNGSYLSKAIDFPGLLTFCPKRVINSCLLQPMRWQTEGTSLAVERALKTGEAAVNLGGGYHHAGREKGWGGCIFSDIPLAIERHASDKRVAIIDLDAHQGDGLEEYANNRDNVWLFDMFNKNEFPFKILEQVSEDRDDETEKCVFIPLDGGHLEQELFGYKTERYDPWCFTEKVADRKIGDEDYLGLLKEKISGFLDKVSPDLVIYNAGTDPYIRDPWGCMAVTLEGLVKRDQLVWREVRGREIPLAMTLSGGYSKDNVNVVSTCILRLLEEFDC